MIYIISIVLIALSILLWRTNGRDQYQLLAVLQSLLTLAVFWMIGEDLSSDNGLSLMALLSGILVIHFGVSRFWKKKEFYWPPAFVLASTALFFLFKDHVFTYSGFDVSLIKPEILILPMLGAIIEPIANTKEKVLGDFFKIDYKSRRGISRGTFVFVIGLFMFVGHFFGSYIGVNLVLLGFGSSLLYNKRSGAVWNMYLGMIAFAAFGHFANIGGIESVDLTQGRVIEGVLLGGAISLFVNTMGRAKKNQLIATGVSWFLFTIVPIGLILLAIIYSPLGGADAFVGLLAGFGFTALLGINTRKNSSLLAVYFAIGLIFLPMLINEEEQEMSTIVIPSNGDKEEKPTDIFENGGKTIDLVGQYLIDNENSQLTFGLGPNGGRTKGAFRKFDGTFTFGETSSIEVKLPVDQLTTFNSMQEESLMGEGYFNEAKYPMMTFDVSKLEAKADSYIANGKFTMMNVTKDLEVEMKYLGLIGTGNTPVFIGRSEIDRTEFGMKSDPKEGNVVDFSFKVELKKAN